ncbi:MAG: hypothetical protein IPM30_16310 [Burkholderiales bacterium]|nr:hypothetical protein [Burkholderiales bacterium]
MDTLKLSTSALRFLAPNPELVLPVGVRRQLGNPLPYARVAGSGRIEQA